MNEQILKRFQDILKLQVCLFEQLEELQWVTKDLIEDLEAELHPIPNHGAKVVEISKDVAAS